MAHRLKVKPTSTEDPKFEKKRQGDRLKAVRAGTSKNMGRDLDTQKAVNTSKKADRGMPVKNKPGSLTNPGGYLKTAASYYRGVVKKALTKGTAVGRAKTKKNKTLGSIAKPGK